MTDDLMKQLRELEDVLARFAMRNGTVRINLREVKMIREAADEIERLREALRNIEGVGSQYSVKSGPAWAMRNIARAALAVEKK